jgi:hypothetical protein
MQGVIGAPFPRPATVFVPVAILCGPYAFIGNGQRTSVTIRLPGINYFIEEVVPVTVTKRSASQTPGQAKAG